MEQHAMTSSELQQPMDVEAKLRDAEKLIARYSGSSNPERQLKLARTIFTKGALLLHTRRFEPALAAFDLLLQTFQDNKEAAIQPQIAKTLLDRAAVLDILGRRDDALAGYARVVEQFGDTPNEAARAYVASAMFNRASLLTRLKRRPEALAALNACLDGPIKLPDRLLAKALWMKIELLENSGRDNESLAACQRLMELFADKKDIVDQNRLCEIMLERVKLLIALDRGLEVISAYEEAEEKFGPVAEEVIGTSTAGYLVQKLKDHTELNRMTEALALAEKACAIFGAFVDPPWFDVAQTAGKTRLVALCRLRRVEACIVAYDTVVEHYGDMLDAATRGEVAGMLLDQSTDLAARKEYAAADKISDQIIQRFKPADDPDLATVSARAMFNKIALKALMGNPHEIMPACDAFIDRFRYSTHPVICEMLFHAWSRKAALLDSQNHDADALQAYEAAVKAGKALSLPALPVAANMAGKAACLSRMGRRAAQLEAYDELISTYGDNSSPGIRTVVAPALLAQAFMLREDGKLELSLASCEQFITWVERSTPAAMIVPLARAMFLRGELLEKLGREVEAAQAYGALAGRFDFNGETEARTCVPVALFNQAALLEKAELHEQSIAVLDALLERARGEPDLISPRLLAQCMLNRAVIYQSLQNTDSALAAYQQVVSNFGPADDSAVRAIVRSALLKKGRLLEKCEKHQDAILAFQTVIDYDVPENLQENKPINTAAAFTIAALLMRMNRPQESVAAYLSAQEKYGGSAEESIRIDMARGLCTLAQQALEGGDFDTALAHDRAINQLFQHDPCPEVLGWVLQTAATTVAVNDKRQQAAAALEQAAKGTDKLPDEIHPAAPISQQQGKSITVDEPAAVELLIPAEVQLATGQDAETVSEAAPIVVVTCGAQAELRAEEALIPAVKSADAPPATAMTANAPQANAPQADAQVSAQAGAVPVLTDMNSPGEHLMHLRHLKWGGHEADLIAGCDEFIKHYSGSESVTVRRDVAEAFRMKIEVVKRSGSLEDELRACNAFLLTFGRETEPAFSPLLCLTMLDRGRVFGQMDRVGHEVAAYDALMQRFGKSNDAALRPSIIETLQRQAVIAGQQSRIGDEVRCYQKLVSKYGNVADIDVQRHVAAAMLSTALALRKLDRKLDELAIYDSIIDRFEKTDDTAILFVVARAMMRKALTQGERGKRQEQIAVCDNIISRFTHSDALFLRQQAARSQCHRAAALAELGKIPEALICYDAAIRQFSDAAEPPLRVCAGLALFQKAELLRGQRRRAEAISCYQHFVQSYQTDDEEMSGLVSQSQSLLRVL